MIYFCTPTYLKLNTTVGQSVDELLIAPLIKSAADSWVRNILGTYFYKDLLTKFNNASLSANEETLVADYVKPAIMWRAAQDVMYHASLQVKNKGVQTQSGDFSSPAEFKAMSFIGHSAREKAELYQGLLFNYLVDNGSLFSTFTTDLNKDSTAKLGACVVNDYNTGIYII